MTLANPTLCGDFCLVPAPQRQGWRDSLARHLVALARDSGEKLIPAWKQEEQIKSARLYVALLLEAGIDDLSAIVAAYTNTSEQRQTYARTDQH